MITIDLDSTTVKVGPPQVQAKVDTRNGFVQIVMDALPSGGGGGGGGGGYMGEWASGFTYPRGAIVLHEDGAWGVEAGAPAGIEPDDNLIAGVLVGSDAFRDATVIRAGSDGMTLNGDDFDGQGLTMETGEPTPMSVITRTAWWSYQPLSSGTITFDTEGASADTILAVYSAAALTTDFAALTLLGYDDDGGTTGYASRLSVAVQEGLTYYVQVGSYGSTTSGNYRLNLTNAMRTAAGPPPVISPWDRLSVSKAGITAFVDGRIQDHKDSTDPHRGYLLADGSRQATGCLVMTGEFANAGFVESAQVWRDMRVGGSIVFYLGVNGPSIGRTSSNNLYLKAGTGGQTTIEIQPANSVRLVGLANPTGAQDAATKAYVDSKGTTPLPTRNYSGYTTASLAAGAMETGGITIGFTAIRLIEMDTDRPARIRLYRTAAKRDADKTRAIGTDPTGDHGLLVELVTTPGAGLMYYLSPLVDCYIESGGMFFHNITNMDTVTATVHLGFLWTRVE